MADITTKDADRTKGSIPRGGLLTLLETPQFGVIVVIGVAVFLLTSPWWT